MEVALDISPRRFDQYHRGFLSLCACRPLIFCAGRQFPASLIIDVREVLFFLFSALLFCKSHARKYSTIALKKKQQEGLSFRSCPPAWPEAPPGAVLCGARSAGPPERGWAKSRRRAGPGRSAG